MINGAVFIFALFKYESDWKSIESPPKEHREQAIGSASAVLLDKESVFSPLVHSNNP